MQVENNFAVDAPLERVWTYLLDVPAVAPCIPGAELTEVVSDTEYKGTVTVKLGAVKVTYKGTVVLNEVDQPNHRVVLKATGSETRGAGAASGTITSTVSADGTNRTVVAIVSEIAISGRVAQFGRNIVQDVSNRLIQEFAKCLEANLAADNPRESSSQSQAPAGREHSAAPKVSASNTRQEDQNASDSPSRPAHSDPLSSGPRATAAEVKLLPILVDISRARLASGLSRLARVIDPHRSDDGS